MTNCTSNKNNWKWRTNNADTFRLCSLDQFLFGAITSRSNAVNNVLQIAWWLHASKSDNRQRKHNFYPFATTDGHNTHSESKYCFCFWKGKAIISVLCICFVPIQSIKYNIVIIYPFVIYRKQFIIYGYNILSYLSNNFSFIWVHYFVLDSGY